MNVRTIIIALAVLVLLLPEARGQSASGNRIEKEKLEKEIAILNNQIKANSSKRKDVMKELKLVRGKVNVRRRMVSESEKRIAGLEKDIRDKQHDIDSLQAGLGIMLDHYTRLVRKTYRIRDSRAWYIYILSAKDFPQASRRYGYMKRLSSRMNIQAEQMKDAKIRLDNEKRSLDEMKGNAQKVRDTRKRELKDLQKDEKTSAALLARLRKDNVGYQAALKKKRRQVSALDREIRKMISSNRSKVATTDVDPKLSGEFAANKGRLPWPVEGSVVDHFGQHYHPVYTKVKLPFNNGVSIAVNPGTNVKAVFSGVVQQIVVMPGYNQCVLVRHGSYYTFYCRLKSVSVHAGDKVRTGQTLGVVDTIGGETQMHFQLWKGSAPQNPELWLQ